MITKKIEKYDELIADARRAKEHTNVLVYQDIKNEFLKYKTSPEYVKDTNALKDKEEKQITEFVNAKELSILRSMIKRRTESAEIYKKANRPENAVKEEAEIEVISGLLPKAASTEEITAAVNDYISSLGHPLTKKDMALAIKSVKEKLPTADGKTVADIVKANISE